MNSQIITTLLQRLGHVLEWVGTIGAVVCFGGAIVFLVDRELWNAGILAGNAVVLYVAGRGFRISFAGK